MKVTIICDVLGEANNGTTIATYNLINYLKKNGHDVKVVTSDKTKSGEEGYYIVPTLNLGPFNYALRRNHVELAHPNKKIIREAIKDADIVHIQFPMALGKAGRKIAKKLNKPITASFHCQAENVTSHVGLMNCRIANKIAYKIFYKNVYKFCDNIHYPTQFIKEEFEKNVGKTKGEVISNGVNDLFFVDRERKKVTDKFLILCTGRYSAEKSQSVLIDAVSKSKYKDNIKVVFAGSGPLKNKLISQAKKLKVDCNFEFFTREDLMSILHGADLYVHTAEIEIEAIACMEAIASGLVPVICNSPRSATRFFALGENNLFKMNDSNDLASKIEYWYENEEKKKECQKAYNNLKNEFSQDECMRRMEKMLYSAMEEHNQNE